MTSPWSTQVLVGVETAPASPASRGTMSRVQRAVGRRHVRGTYDAAQSYDSDANHWAAADDLSADAANSTGVRKSLRRRSRYEVANGGYAKRMVRVKANDLVGTGPHLQMLAKRVPAGASLTLEEFNDDLETEWTIWMRAARFARALRTLVKAKIQDGEALGIKVTKRRLTTPAKVALRPLECDRLTTPTMFIPEPNKIDGMDLDENGDPTVYHILQYHPGGNSFYSLAAKQYPASAVVHWYEEDRPEQHRGIPEFTPTLRTFGKFRQFQQATIDAARTAARVSAVIQTKNPPDDDSEAPVALDTFELEPDSAMVLPDGYEIGQVRSEHPATTHGDFCDQTITELGAPILMPRNIASGDSSAYNYASGRLDHQTYDFGNDIDRDDVEIVVVEPVFEDWLRETLAVKYGITPSEVQLIDYQHEWRWDSRGHVDPTKEASADETQLKTGATSLSRIYGKSGLDGRKELTRLAGDLGIGLPELQKLIRTALFGGGQQQQQPGAKPVDDDSDDEAPASSARQRRNGSVPSRNGSSRR